MGLPTLNVCPRPFAARAAIRLYGKLGLYVVLDLGNIRTRHLIGIHTHLGDSGTG
jgi:hypothetical protein